MRHVEEPGRPGHKMETAEERLREGERTIDSAYRGGGKMRRKREGLPNAVRERLLSGQKSTIMARFLDAMMLAKWETDSYLR